MASFIDLPTTVKILALAMVVIVAYLFLKSSRNPQLKQSVPVARAAPVALTRAGLMTPTSREELGNGKYMIHFDDNPTGYKPVYYKFGSDDFGLIQIDQYQATFQGGRPILIEHEVLCELAWNKVYAPQNMEARMQLHSIAEKLKSKQEVSTDELKIMLKQIESIAKIYNEPAQVWTSLHEKLGKATDKASRMESNLRESESGIEGKVHRRLEPIINVATARAKPSRDEQRTQ